jgi:hypothetical protein
MDVAQFKAYVTCTVTLDQVPSLSSSSGFTYPLFIYSNTNSNLITFLTLILGSKVLQSLFKWAEVVVSLFGLVLKVNPN